MASNPCKTWLYRAEQLCVSIDNAYLLGTEIVNTPFVLLSVKAYLKAVSNIA